MKTITRTKRLFLLCLVLCVLLGFGYAFLYREVIRISKRLEETEGTIARRTATEGHLALLRQTAAGIEKKEKTLENFLIRKDRVVDFIQAIEQFGSSIGVQIEVSSINEEAIAGEKTALAEFLQLRIVGRGAWEGLFRLLLYFESMPYAGRVTHVVLRRSGEEVDAGWNGYFNVSVLKEQ